MSLSHALNLATADRDVAEAFLQKVAAEVAESGPIVKQAEIPGLGDLGNMLSGARDTVSGYMPEALGADGQKLLANALLGGGAGAIALPALGALTGKSRRQRSNQMLAGLLGGAGLGLGIPAVLQAIQAGQTPLVGPKEQGELDTRAQKDFNDRSLVDRLLQVGTGTAPPGEPDPKTGLPKPRTLRGETQNSFNWLVNADKPDSTLSQGVKLFDEVADKANELGGQAMGAAKAVADKGKEVIDNPVGSAAAGVGAGLSGTANAASNHPGAALGATAGMGAYGANKARQAVSNHRLKPLQQTLAGFNQSLDGNSPGGVFKPHEQRQILDEVTALNELKGGAGRRLAGFEQRRTSTPEQSDLYRRALQAGKRIPAAPKPGLMRRGLATGAKGIGSGLLGGLIGEVVGPYVNQAANYGSSFLPSMPGLSSPSPDYIRQNMKGFKP